MRALAAVALRAATTAACGASRGIGRSWSGGGVDCGVGERGAARRPRANTPAAISLPRIASRRARSRVAFAGLGA